MCAGGVRRHGSLNAGPDNTCSRDRGTPTRKRLARAGQVSPSAEARRNITTQPGWFQTRASPHRSAEVLSAHGRSNSGEGIGRSFSSRRDDRELSCRVSRFSAASRRSAADFIATRGTGAGHTTSQPGGRGSPASSGRRHAPSITSTIPSHLGMWPNRAFHSRPAAPGRASSPVARRGALRPR